MRARVVAAMLTLAGVVAALAGVASLALFHGGAAHPAATPPASPAATGTAAGPTPGTTSGPAQATVTISAQAQARRVPRSFLGISTEYWTLPVWARHMSELDRVLSLVSANGTPVLRIGGDSADHAFWAPTQELPEWVFELTPGWLAQVRDIVRSSGVRLILDLNLVTATPQDAVRWARAAEAALPTESIVGFEIGNEPDIYSHRSWLSLTGGAGSRTLPQAITGSDYAQVFDTYARALERVDPGVPLLGPALAEPQARAAWVARLLAGPHPGLTAVTVHRYPYSECARPSARTYPTIARVLSENATAGMARTVHGVVRLATRAGFPVRLTEINSVTCGGRRGVSDTFATALWAPDALFELLRAGVASASVHVRANAINMAFSLTRHGVVADPLLYGMILFSRVLGADPKLVPLQLRVRPSLHLKAWAVRTRGDRLNVLLIDKGSADVRVDLRLPATGAASVQRLLAASVRSRSGVTLDGRHLDAQARWTGHAVTETVTPGPRGYELTVRGISAAVVSVALRAGAIARVSGR